MPARAIHHVDLAVGDVERSLAFYLAVLGPLGLREAERYPTYRGTEEVVYLRYGDQYLGLRPADGGTHHYYDVGIEHLAFYVGIAPGSTSRPKPIETSRATTSYSCSIQMGSASRSATAVRFRRLQVLP